MANQLFLKQIVLAVALAGVAFGTAQAASVNANARANVMTPLSITNPVAMNFGDVAGDADAATTVTLQTDGTVVAAPGAYAANNGAAALFEVKGVDGASYSIDFNGGSDITLSGAGAPMTISNVSLVNTATGTLTGGIEQFNLGGTLTLNAGQAAGVYTGTYTVTVAY